MPMDAPTRAQLHDAALAYASFGLAVFPTHAPLASDRCTCETPCGEACGKHPREGEGFHGASTRSRDVDTWLARYPHMGLGIPTGLLSDGPHRGNWLVVLNVDTRRGGRERLEELQDRYGALPEGPLAYTGDGEHRYFLSDVPVASSRKGLGAGVSVHGDEGYVMAAPSLHPSGKHYAWDVERGLGDLPLPTLPAWVHAQLAREAQRTDLLPVALGYARRGVSVMPLCQPLFDDDGKPIVRPNGSRACTHDRLEPWRKPTNSKTGNCCDGPGKEPHFEIGSTRATTDEATIRSWFTRAEAKGCTINLGLVYGPGYFTFDVDSYKGGDEPWARIREALELTGGLHVSTGGGGHHWTYKDPTPDGLRQSIPRVLNGQKLTVPYKGAEIMPIDVRARRGYLVGPGSLHANGKLYVADPETDFLRGFEPAVLPEACVAWLPTNSPTLVGSAESRSTGERLPGTKYYKGERGHESTRMAGKMLALGFSEELVLATLLRVNVEQFEPPLDEKEIRRALRWVVEKEEAKREAEKKVREEMEARGDEEELVDDREDEPATPPPAASQGTGNAQAPREEPERRHETGIVQDGTTAAQDVLAVTPRATEQPKELPIIDVKAEVAADTTSDPAAPRERPVIFVDHELPRMVNEGIDALAQHPGIYQREGIGLTRILISQRLEGEDDTAPVLNELPQSTASQWLMEVADWEKQITTRNGPMVVPTQPPPNVVKILVEQRVYPASMRPLRSMIEAPGLRRDGTVLTQPGYDPATGLILLWKQQPLEIGTPSQDEAAAAYKKLTDLFVDFQFTEEEKERSLAAVVCAILTPLARQAIEGPVPATIFNADGPDAGKSLLASVVGTIVTGRPPAVRQYTPDDEELHKRLASVALEGHPIMLLDNIRAHLEGGALEAFLTAYDTVACRILGKMEDRELRWRTSILMTANHATISADLQRRMLHVGLKSSLGKPRKDFRIPKLLKYTQAHRLDLLTAALKILRGYACAGHPAMSARLASFEGWTDTVAKAVEWASTVDPTQAKAPATADRERDVADRVVLSWYEAFGTTEVSVAQLRQVFAGFKLASGPTFDEKAKPELGSALSDLMGVPDFTRVTPQLMGRRLERVLEHRVLQLDLTKERPVHAFKLKKAGQDRMHAQQYIIVELETSKEELEAANRAKLAALAARLEPKVEPKGVCD